MCSGRKLEVQPPTYAHSEGMPISDQACTYRRARSHTGRRHQKAKGVTRSYEYRDAISRQTVQPLKKRNREALRVRRDMNVKTRSIRAVIRHLHMLGRLDAQGRSNSCDAHHKLRLRRGCGCVDLEKILCFRYAPTSIVDCPRLQIAHGDQMKITVPPRSSQSV